MNFIADIFFSHTVSCGKQLFTAAGIFQQQNQFFPGQIMVVFGFSIKCSIIFSVADIRGIFGINQ